ncbi:putative orfan [Tupanvirus soda lake]|uniref:Orfan n=2 Tax=Tupanvirus TaxID=2094720 RepID=A0AC62ACW0_9VIRU|nr:putative orfan [Tupanvirus soda lake]QKU35591.1 putative orfan [Tupanvirus soda lake]
MTDETLYGDIFIVPNSLQVCDNTGSYAYTVENTKGLQVCFEGWMTNEECKNWSAHHYEKFDGAVVSDRFPVELFMGKREGDIVEMVISGKKCALRCAQLPYRYGSNGTVKFEDLLYDLTQSFGGVCSQTYFAPPLHERSQHAMLLANHERYARSIGRDSVEPTKFRYVDSYIKQCKLDTGIETAAM